jgi:protein-S-isoprenylcysteine O-methyltransferase Ste14
VRRIPPAAWLLALLGAAWGLERGRALPLGMPSVEARVAAACALFGGAALVAGWAIVLFGRRRTTVVPFAEASALVTSGPYRFSRNPLYAALVASLAAFGLLLDSAWYLAGAARVRRWL